MSHSPAEQEPKTTSPEVHPREANGRFARGNKGGPGNPFGRRLAQLRQLVVEAVSEDDLREVVHVLVARAKDGDVAAIKLLLQYVVGKPMPAAEPDRVDVEEWQLAEASSVASERVEAVALHGTPVQLASQVAAVMEPVKMSQLQQTTTRHEAKLQKRAARQAEEEADLDPEELLHAVADDPQMRQLWEALAQGVSVEELAGAATATHGDGQPVAGNGGPAPSPNGRNGEPAERRPRGGANRAPGT